MAFFVNKNLRMAAEIGSALQSHFGDKAQVSVDSNNCIHIEVYSRFPMMQKSLSQDQIDDGVFGGGIFESLDGKKFLLKMGK